MNKFPWKSKTLYGGLIIGIVGLYLIAVGETTEGVECLGLALAILGIRHKLEVEL